MTNTILTLLKSELTNKIIIIEISIYPAYKISIEILVGPVNFYCSFYIRLFYFILYFRSMY